MPKSLGLSAEQMRLRQNKRHRDRVYTRRQLGVCTTCAAEVAAPNADGAVFLRCVACRRQDRKKVFPVGPCAWRGCRNNKQQGHRHCWGHIKQQFRNGGMNDLRLPHGKKR